MVHGCSVVDGGLCLLIWGSIWLSRNWLSILVVGHGLRLSSDHIGLLTWLGCRVLIDLLVTDVPTGHLLSLSKVLWCGLLSVKLANVGEVDL